MKSLKKVAVLLAALFVGSSAFASDFDWSQCWCNYGAGLEDSKVIVDVGGGLTTNVVSLFFFDDAWFIPAVEASFELPVKVWKLPFTFGGSFYYQACGFKIHNTGYGDNIFSENDFAAAAIAKYHVMLPPKNLDVYAVVKLGAEMVIVQDVYSSGKDNSYNKWAPFYAADIGATWYFNDSFGVNVEFGYPVAMRVGISLKF